MGRTLPYGELKPRAMAAYSHTWEMPHLTLRGIETHCNFTISSEASRSSRTLPYGELKQVAEQFIDVPVRDAAPYPTGN